MDYTQKDIPVRIEKPWGWELWWAWTDDYVGKIIHVNKGHKLSLQFHEQKDETSLLTFGKMILVRGTSADALTETEITAGHQWRNEPGVIHTVEALEDSEFVEVSTPHLEDVVRLSDEYGREGTSAP